MKITPAIRNTLVPAIFRCLARLPLSGARALGVVIGTCMWLARGRGQRVTLKNLRACLPHLSPKEAQQLTRESLIETAKTATEAAIIWRNSWAWLQTKIVAVEGEELLRAELAQGRGLIALAPHLGNWEVIAPYLVSVAPLTAMYQPASIPKMDALILAGRSKCNIQMAPTNRKGVGMLLKTLQAGNIVGILPDQLPKYDAGAEFAPFFGQDVLTMTMVHSLQSRTQSRVISLFAKRVPGGFNVIIVPADPAIYSQDPLQATRGLNASVEACVRVAPAQYQWEYNRFRYPKRHQAMRAQKAQAQASNKPCDSEAL